MQRTMREYGAAWLFIRPRNDLSMYRSGSVSPLMPLTSTENW